MKHPILLQIFTRVYLGELSNQLGRPATLADVSDETLDRWAATGFDYIWLLGVWQTGERGRTISQTASHWQSSFQQALADLLLDDISGSPFAIQSYAVHQDFGATDNLSAFRARLKKRGLKLILDFVPNHLAIDNPWVWEFPDYFVAGTEDELQRQPQNFLRVETKNGETILAYGRDPYFDGWPDTLQLNYQNRDLKRAMQTELATIANQCDGVRCDMAMLISPEIFSRTWGERHPTEHESRCDLPFWPTTIEAVHRQYPSFIFMAEVYWDLEAEMLRQGFDFAYDKRLYDLLRELDSVRIHEHLWADLEFQNRMVRFLENHDEPRAAHTFQPDVHCAAALITYLAPGLRLFYEGQFEGRKSHASVHLNRRTAEPVDAEIQVFYQRLLECLRRTEIRTGLWRLLICQRAWDDNPTADKFIAFCWQQDEQLTVVIVNYGSTQGQCVIRLPFVFLTNRSIRLNDLFAGVEYVREGNESVESGIYIDLPAWGYHVFEILSDDNSRI